MAAALAVATGMALAAAGTTALITSPVRPPAHLDIGTLPVSQAAGPHDSTAAPAAPPVRIRIAHIALDESLAGLQVQQDGHLGVPENPHQVGWWSGGPRPGDPGAAIIIGHVDSRTGPAAFYRLPELRPGDEISIDRADRSRADFTVRALRQFDKDDFPDDQVYATTGSPSLRLITCGGAYDSALGGYRDNLVVYATLAAEHPPHTSPSPITTHRSGN
ncbi:class F sortase [Streptomyces sp. H10-C2]|uniref:class F sortase n=1 Tax=unclassified Streptomyces TaxID=2593676 RepID=UPI0024BAC578|nr:MULTISPECIES: class F sortase [unclassified Streptomyces]MDJ0347427.1 class F sortase [Streptomyces sp. PH10-H1]MDJ0375663.1 class F sortase [Streptomyces sp. H10-C2]